MHCSSCHSTQLRSFCSSPCTAPLPSSLLGTGFLAGEALGNSGLLLAEWAEPGAFPYLTTLSLGNNELSGSLDALGPGMPNLAYVVLNDNLFTGSLPASLFQSATLTLLSLRNNSISGTPRLPAFTVSQLASWHKL